MTLAVSGCGCARGPAQPVRAMVGGGGAKDRRPRSTRRGEQRGCCGGGGGSGWWGPKREGQTADARGRRRRRARSSRTARVCQCRPASPAAAVTAALTADGRGDARGDGGGRGLADSRGGRAGWMRRCRGQLPSAIDESVPIHNSYTYPSFSCPVSMPNPPSRPLPFLVDPLGHLKTATKGVRSCTPTVRAPHHPDRQAAWRLPAPPRGPPAWCIPPPPPPPSPPPPLPLPSPSRSLPALLFSLSWSASLGHYLAAMVAARPPQRGAHPFLIAPWSARLLGCVRGVGGLGRAGGGEGARPSPLCRCEARGE